MGLWTRMRAAGGVLLKGANTHPAVVEGRSMQVSSGLIQMPTSPPADIKAIRESEEIHPVVSRCVKVIARDCARARLRLMKRGPKEAVEVDPTHPAIAPLLHVNDYMPHEQWREFIVADLLVTGNSYNNIIRAGGRPKEFWRMVPDQITPKPGKTSDTFIEYYSWRDTLDEEHTYKPQDVLHFMTRGRTPHSGIGLIEPLRDSLTLDRYIRDWRENFFKAGVPSTLLFTRDPAYGGVKLKDKDMERMADRVHAMTRGDRAGRPVFLDGWNITPIPRPTEAEISFIATMHFIRAEILMEFGVTPVQASDYSDAFRANADQQDKGYWHNTVMGMNRLLVSFLNGVYLEREFPDSGLFFDLDYAEIDALAPNQKELADGVVALVNGGVITPAEARTKAGYDAPEGTVENAEAMHYVYLKGRKLGDDPLPAGSFGTDGNPLEPDENADTDEPSAQGKDKILSIASLSRAKSLDDWFRVQDEIEILRLQTQRIIRRMIESAAEEQIVLDGLTSAFNALDTRVLNRVALQASRVAQAVVPTTHEIIRLAIARGIEAGLPVNSADMRDRIQAAFSVRRQNWQLDRIARTETHQAQESGAYWAIVQNGVPYKQWSTALDEKVRQGAEKNQNADHESLEGVVIPVESRFFDASAHAYLQFPGDSDAGVPATVINCRCVLLSAFTADGGRKPQDIEKAVIAKAATADVYYLTFKNIILDYLLALERRVLAGFDVESQSQGAQEG